MRFDSLAKIWFVVDVPIVFSLVATGQAQEALVFMISSLVVGAIALKGLTYE